MDLGGVAVSHFFGGCYEAARAAALSGVPRSTVYDWARKGIVVPSVSPDQEKLWSYADLMALRAVSWLRHIKHGDDGVIPASPMRQVRAALDALTSEGLAVWQANVSSPLVVEASGRILIHVGETLRDPVTDDVSLPGSLHTFGLTSPFNIDGQLGPDLIRPGEHLRIVPGKVAGEPHVAGTRITTVALASLVSQGYPPGQVAQMYDLPAEVVVEASMLEDDLGTFLVAA